MKVIYSILLSLTLSGIVYSQQSPNFVQQEIAKVNNYLSKYDKAQVLSTTQISDLSKVFESKEIALNELYKKKLPKLEVSKAVTQIENDYQSRVETFLTLDQRLIFSKIKKSSKIADTN